MWVISDNLWDLRFEQHEDGESATRLVHEFRLFYHRVLVIGWTGTTLTEKEGFFMGKIGEGIYLDSLWFLTTKLT